MILRGEVRGPERVQRQDLRLKEQSCGYIAVLWDLQNPALGSPAAACFHPAAFLSAWPMAQASLTPWGFSCHKSVTS